MCKKARHKPLWRKNLEYSSLEKLFIVDGPAMNRGSISHRTEVMPEWGMQWLSRTWKEWDLTWRKYSSIKKLAYLENVSLLILVLLGVGSSLLRVRTELLVLIPGNSPSQEVAPPLLLEAQASCLTTFLSAIWSTSQIDSEINYLSLLASSSMPHDSKGLLSDLQLQFQPPTQAALNSRASGVLWKP